MNKLLNPDEVRKWHRAFKHDGELFEIRLLAGKNDKTYSGYFTDVEDAIKAIIPFDATKMYQVYFTVNEVNPACSSRKQYNQFMIVSGSATSKNDIVHRWVLPIDIDVKRPTDISSTDEEKNYAYQKANDVYVFLNQCGFPQPIVCDSSSGYHMYYPIDLENNADTEKLVYTFYEVLGTIFTDDRIKIDRSVGDANRIMRLPGSWGRKGRDSEERPHRMAYVMSSPESSSRVGYDFINAFIEKYKVKEERPVYSAHYGSGREPFDLRKFINDHGLNVRNEAPYGDGGTKFVLEECPFDSSHKAPDSAIFLSANGAIGFRCLHDSCANHNWHELRKMLDPTAYENEYQPQQQWTPRTIRKSVTQPQVKEETPELGKKWLDLSEVEDVNLDDIQRAHTGFRDLDDALGGGLFMGETTILSGINGSGKSAWLDTLALNVIQDGFPVALWTMELQSYRLKRWLLLAAAGHDCLNESTKNPGRWYVPNDVKTKIVNWLRGRFMLYNNDYSSNFGQIINDLDEAVKRGAKIVILDNLFAMDLEGLEGDENARQKTVILSLVEYAKKHNIHLILVAHPRKVVTFLRKEDILGSSALQNGVDNIAIIHRTGRDFEKRSKEIFSAGEVKEWMKFGNVLELCKNREFGSLERMIGLYYDLRSKRFTDGKEPVIRYDWGEIDYILSKSASISSITTGNEANQKALPFNTSNDDAVPF